MLRLGGAMALAIVLTLGLPAGGFGLTRADPLGRRTVALGRSVQGREITAVETGDFDARRRALVVGCIHGDETAGIAVARRLAGANLPHELDLWIVADLNPDGAAANRRGNAHGVDLNRNFPWRWRRLAGIFDSGPRPLSEPESRIAYRLIRRIDPGVSIWFHQHLNAVDDSGGSIAVERSFARVTRQRLVPLIREPGSAVGWTNHSEPTGSAFVVELPPGRLGHGALARFTQAVLVTSAPGARNSPAR
jgi:protein MpaA